MKFHQKNFKWNTFLDLQNDEKDFSSCSVVIIPIGYDGTASYKPGAKYGPNAIINSSVELENYDIEMEKDITETGIFTTPEISPLASDPKEMLLKIETTIDNLKLKNQITGIIGGDHSVTIGSVKSAIKRFPDLSILYLDAHADLRDTYMGTKWGHASVARRLKSICKVVQLGVRSISSEEVNFISKSKSENEIYYWDRTKNNLQEDIDSALSQLSNQVYISIDLDVLDPSIMSAVGNPVPGGINWEEINSIIKQTAQHHSIIGFDVTELSPNEGPESCSFTAAKLIYKLIGFATEKSNNKL
ncbi:MAG: agmatinase [Chloroflexi bacterium]|nr:agmatinase [Chloroflexota bacterium]|tara:strand:+ start:62031 stop:62936 length:906 start_codon:yes stop_codon:yes gene_type:complete